MGNPAMYDGKVYVTRVKPTLVKNWDAVDLVYALTYEGHSGFTFSNFKQVCEKNNKRWFLSKKANVKDDSSCSWAEIVACMEGFPAIGVQTISITDRAVTFLEVATLAYQLEIFLDPGGLEFVTDCNEKVPSKQTVAESGKVA
jgi:hypothetical protein